jgi:two-component system response regulator HydG
MAIDALRILVIDDDKKLAEAIAESLLRKGYAVAVAHTGPAGLAMIAAAEFDVVLTDLKMADFDGLEVVRRCRETLPDAEVYVITGSNDVRTAVEAMKLGASHYLLKPIDLHELRAIVEKAAERAGLAQSNRDLRRQIDEKFGYEGVVGNSPRMYQVLRQLRAYAPTAASVLIFGENGTGKELAAKALHVNSPRKAKPFVAMNCAALNENLLDDELFGHEAGAFTDGKKSRKGRFEYADGGTLFLDEIGDMPLTLQAKLLRVLENGEVVRIGANDAVKVDVRVIAATNKNLEAMIEENRFRRDLFYRLRVGVIRLPALRERKEDITLLATHFLKELSAKHKKPVAGMTEPLRKWLVGHDWPGNVRELRNLIDIMIVHDVDGELGLDDLPPDESALAANRPLAIGGAGSDWLVGRPLDEVERFYMEKALELSGGNREEASRMLGIGERTLYRKIQEWKRADKGYEPRAPLALPAAGSRS